MKKKLELLMKEEDLIKLGFAPIQNEKEPARYLIHDKEHPIEVIYRYDEEHKMYRFEAQEVEHKGKYKR